MFRCIHCDEAALVPIYLNSDSGHTQPFCCEGCLTVYEVITGKGFSSYYDLKKSSGIFKRRSPVNPSQSTFVYLDDESFRRSHCYFDGVGHSVMDFYLEGIHCLACLWLIEKLPEIIPGVVRSKLDLEKSVASISISDEGKFSLVAKELDRIGYRPHALDRNEDAKKLRAREEQSILKRIGVAGAAAGNIMIYSVSLYGGADATIGKVFNVLTVLFALPVFTYSAWPFYQSAWTSLRNKTLSIDIPIALSLVMGFVMGIRGLILHFEENYFDSLTALVFLLLLSRYFLRKIQDRGLSTNDLRYFYQTESVLRQKGSEFEEVHTQFLNVGDVIKVKRDEFLPADGVIVSGDSLINNSLLTGESVPDHVKSGHFVFSGTQNLGDDLIVEIKKLNADSRLGQILKNVEQGWALRSRTVDLTSRVAKYFTLAVILLSVVLFIKEGSLSRALTLLIVTCPCALAISVPLTFHRSLSMAAENGIIVKSDEVFEKLAHVKKIFLDKTGTITVGKLLVTDFHSERVVLDEILTLEKWSRHPVARALCEYARKLGARTLEVTGHREIPGKGVEGYINDHFYEISGGELREDGIVIARFRVRDGIRPDSRENISRLRTGGREVSILSGDKNDVVARLADEAGLSCYDAEISPEMKAELVSGKGLVMVGDGANDAMALERADIGIAVSGAMDISLRAADVYLTAPGLSGVEKLMTLSEETMKIVRRNLILSLLYNCASVFFVFTGVINPLVAAIVMPVSSLTVLLSTLMGTRKMRSLWK